MKKTRRKAATAKQTPLRGPGRPTKKRLAHIASDVMARERGARRSLDQQAERAAKAKRKNLTRLHWNSWVQKGYADLPYTRSITCHSAKPRKRISQNLAEKDK